MYPECPNVIERLLWGDLIVQFTKAKGAEHIPLPKPALLDCHYRLAEILHALSMGDHIEKKLQNWRILKDCAGPGHLDADGSTDVARFLQVTLWENVAG
ncbi:hypothetical protein BDW71DRAFT_173261 [Aspergillus fruticulosus]